MDIPPHPGRKLFVNVGVADLQRSVAFFTRLGFTFDPRFTDDACTCMNVGEDAYVMLLTNERLGGFATKPLTDPAASTEALYCFSAEDRESVDRIADIALEAGGSPAKEATDYGFMYGRSSADPDGHHWEVMWMEPAAVEHGPQGMATADGEPALA